MSTDDSKPFSLREARDGVRSLQFFVAAMAAQLRDLHDRLDQATETTPSSSSEGSGASVSAASQSGAGSSQALQADLQEVAALRTRVAELERQNSDLQQDLARQSVTFADHHAAKQEIARLREELDSFRMQGGDEGGDRSSPRKRWSLGK